MTILKVEPVSFDTDGPESVYAYVDVHYAVELTWKKENDREKNRYFYFTSSNGVYCIFELTASAAKKYEAALTSSAQRFQAGDVSVLNVPAILRVQGYAACLDQDLITRIPRMGNDKFCGMFGNYYLKQSSNRAWTFVILGILLFAFGFDMYGWTTMFDPESGRLSITL